MFLKSMKEQDALKHANAVPMGLLSTIYAAILDHHQKVEYSYVTLRQAQATPVPIGLNLVPTCSS